MTDALCGPANPLQNFQKHAQADRTLQQDRFVSRQQPSAQGFRSDNPADVGLLDPEFEAFQAGQLPLGPLGGSPFEQQHARFQSPPPATNSFGIGGWANDFAKLQLSPQPPAQPHFQAPQQNGRFQQQSPTTSSWHTDFARSQQSSPLSMQQHQPYQPRFGGMSSMSPFANAQQPMGYMPSSLQNQTPSSEERWKGKGRWQPEEAHETAAWEAEFEALTKEQLREVKAVQQHEQADSAQHETNHLEQPQFENAEGFDLNNVYRQSEEERVEEQTAQERAEDTLQDIEDRSATNGLLPHDEHYMEMMRQRLVDDSEQDAQQEQPQEQQTQPDVDAELAHTAGVLLDTVSDNQSEKFQQSDFLALMRQFRDHEVKVEGDKVVEINQVVETNQAEVNKASEHLEAQQDADPLRHAPPQSETRTESSSETPHDDPSRHSYSAHVANVTANVADQMGLSRSLTDTWMRQDNYMRPGGHPVDDF